MAQPLLDLFSTPAGDTGYGELLTSPLFALTLTLAAFQAANWLYRRLGQFPLLHPTMVGAVLVAGALSWLELPYEDYYADNGFLMFWLGPATVALAVPLYQQLRLIRQMALPILVTVVAGAVFAAGSAVTIAHWLGGAEVTLLSLAPKSVTTPIAIDLAEDIGGLTTLAAGAVALTAVVGICTAPLIYRLLGIDDPRVRGLCLGITAHGMGTARAFEDNPTAGAFSSLAMCLTGVLTAILLPLAARLWLM